MTGVNDVTDYQSVWPHRNITRAEYADINISIQSHNMIHFP